MAFEIINLLTYLLLTNKATVYRLEITRLFVLVMLWHSSSWFKNSYLHPDWSDYRWLWVYSNCASSESCLTSTTNCLLFPRYCRGTASCRAIDKRSVNTRHDRQWRHFCLSYNAAKLNVFTASCTKQNIRYPHTQLHFLCFIEHLTRVVSSEIPSENFR